MISITDDELKRLSDYVREHYGVNLINKRTLIEGRLGLQLSARGFDSYGEYLNFVINSPDKTEISNMLNRLTTNHTYFMRESDHFTFFQDTVLPWIDGELHDKDLRLWSAGCSTGQEAYALSISILEYTGTHISSVWDSKMLASDISNEALRVASNGIYENEDLSSVPENLRSKYFIPVDEKSSRVIPALRNNIAFKNINLMDPIDAKKPFHTIFCRNVMIYFDNPTKMKLIDNFYDAIIPGGYFFIGHSESLATLDHRFTYVRPSIYRKEV
ncbi:MAG: protein-glutamate O-methyltransferase CheR [Clostridiales Family XIII bacterium]|jgi:chemotaxis protein methyltransferase CheR|nr:protein-glutamate O-methyltransferase CheR [Clostridiales Family XIII bacterium]